MEGESGIVVRGIGTAVMITKITSLKYPLKITTEYAVTYIYHPLFYSQCTFLCSSRGDHIKETCKSASPTAQIPNGTAASNFNESSREASLANAATRRMSDSDLNINHKGKCTDPCQSTHSLQLPLI